MAITPEQLEARRLYLGSSDIAAICGLCPYRFPIQVYNSKVLGIDKPAGKKARIGTLLEDDLIELACDKLQEKYGHPIKLDVGRMVIHENGIFCANLDAECIEVEEPFVLEAKNIFGERPDKPHPQHVKTPSGALALMTWGRSGSNAAENVPLAAWLQVQWQMLCTGYSLGWVACGRWWMGDPCGLWRIPRDQQTIDVISEKAMEFWQACVVPKIPPAVLGKDQEVVNAA
jgi:predicted phage-related endonuclease